jgi:hypothetical protein
MDANPTTELDPTTNGAPAPAPEAPAAAAAPAPTPVGRTAAFARGGTYRKYVAIPVRDENELLLDHVQVWVDFRRLNAGDMIAVQEASLVMTLVDGEPQLRTSMGQSKKAAIARAFVAWELGDPLQAGELDYLDPAVLEALYDAVELPEAAGPFVASSSTSRPPGTPPASQ